MVGPHGGSFSIDMVGHPHGGTSWWVLLNRYGGSLSCPHGGSLNIDMVGHSHGGNILLNRYGGSLSWWVLMVGPSQ